MLELHARSAAWHALTLALLPAIAFALLPVADVPLLPDSRQPWVAVDIGTHREVHCIVDTGASAGVSPSRYLDGAKQIRTVQIETATGLVPAPVMRVPSVRVGHAQRKAVDFFQQDQSWFHAEDGMPCVLGTNFLAAFTVEFDGPGERLRFFARGTRIEQVLGKDANANRLRTSFEHGSLIDTEVSIGGIGAAAQVDTGWVDATPNNALLKALHVSPDDPRIQSARVANPLSGNLHESRTIELADLIIGSVREVHFSASVSETNMPVVNGATKPYLQIGWDILRRHRLIVDWANREVALVP